METSFTKSYFPRGTYKFLPIETDIPSMVVLPDLELYESDIWNLSVPRSLSPELRRTLPTLRPSLKSIAKVSKRSDPSPYGTASHSLAVNIPDWPKILKGCYGEIRREGTEDDVKKEGEEDMVDRFPPHEFLAKQFASASFSMIEGVGRTLKGRDLSRVRNVIWEKIGFQN